MPLRTESLEEPGLNLTPMIDIVFLLIIFFMVGTQFNEIEDRYDIELPTAAPVKPMTRRPDPLVINVAKSGTISLDGQPIAIEKLTERLQRARERFAEQSVLIRGDGKSGYQSMIDVMNVCHQSQIRFSLAFQPSLEPVP